MITKRGRFLLNLKEEDLGEVNKIDFELLEKEYQRIASFYNFDISKIPIIRIVFINNKEEYLFYMKKEYEFKWAWARAFPNFYICIFSPKACEKYTSNKKEEIFKTLIHEISHIIYHSYNFKNTIFDEGLAYYLSDNYKNKKPNFDNIDSIYGSGNYILDKDKGYLLTKYILENIENGNKKLLDFLGKLELEPWKDLFFKIFDKTFEEIFEEMKGGNLK